MHLRKMVALRPIQYKILVLLARGEKNLAISGELNVSIRAIDYYIKDMEDRFGAKNRVNLVYEAMRRNIIS